MNLLPYQIHVLLEQKTLLFMQHQQTALTGVFSQMVVMREFAVVIATDNTTVKDAVQIKMENAFLIGLNVKESYERNFLHCTVIFLIVITWSNIYMYLYV